MLPAVSIQSSSVNVCYTPIESPAPDRGHGLTEMGVYSCRVWFGCAPCPLGWRNPAPTLNSPSATCSSHLYCMLSCHLDGASSNSVCHLLNVTSSQLPCRFYFGCARGIHCSWLALRDSVSHQLLCRLNQAPFLCTLTRLQSSLDRPR